MDLLAIGEVAARAGLTPSALRHYEAEGLLSAERTSGGARRYPRSVLRRLAFVRAAQNVGLSLPEIREALASLPDGRTPSPRDWERLSLGWRDRLGQQIAALVQLRDGLSSCIGCGCLSLSSCGLSNPGDAAAAEGPGARRLSPVLRRLPPAGRAAAPGAPRAGHPGRR